MDSEVPPLMKKYTSEIRELDEKKLFADAETMADKKVSLSEELYNKIDDNIKKLDAQSRLEQEARERNTKQVEQALANAPSPIKKFSSARRDKRKSAAATQSKAARLAQNEAAMNDFQPGAPLVNDMEMPIDPNEPLYCTCHSVSFGEMIACDNDDCPTEWFHFACVGLTKVPEEGTWYCPSCRPQVIKKKK
ncbi:unnamed protein product [Caenorhabditis bovis]|uniref:PHD-type domain-containing protein n=1 Tax=Caenorhabditis bovis TaxID=2654633 RepID=A0A8S1FDX5_9PELO|nr:unnamed protein product [Caenorhabditis bovis]